MPSRGCQASLLRRRPEDIGSLLVRVLRTTVLRLERHLAALGLTDGMLAAVITVMVLELNIPHDASLAAFAGPAVSAEPDA